MYDELIKALRGCVLPKPCDGCPYYDPNGPTEKCATMNIAAADAIEELSATISKMEKATRWIPVNERLPEENALCIVYNKDYGPMVGWRVDGERFRIPGSHFPDHPTHWMPLPLSQTILLIGCRCPFPRPSYSLDAAAPAAEGSADGN